MKMIFTRNFRFSIFMIMSLLTLFHGRDVHGQCERNINEVRKKFNSAFEDVSVRDNNNRKKIENTVLFFSELYFDYLCICTIFSSV